MIFYLLKDGRMSETERNQFFKELAVYPERLIYIKDEQSIDIIKRSDADEYDFSHLVALIETDGEENLQSVIQELHQANVSEE